MRQLVSLTCSGALSIVLASGAAACEQRKDGGAEDDTVVVTDSDLRRAKVSACLGHSFTAAIAFFGPDAVGGVADSVAKCIDAAEDCDGVRACAGVTTPACSTERCDGTTAVHCRELPNGVTYEVAEQCSNANSSCDTISISDGVFAVCNSGACKGERCMDGALVFCDGDVEVVVDCSSQGQTCEDYYAGSVCALPGECTTDHCDGNFVVLCLERHVTFREDCSRLVPGSVCKDTAGPADCVAPERHPSCPPEPYATWCEGPLGVACMAGVRIETDCSQFHDGRCEEDSDGLHARCKIEGWP